MRDRRLPVRRIVMLIGEFVLFCVDGCLAHPPNTWASLAKRLANRFRRVSSTGKIGNSLQSILSLLSKR